MESKAKIVNFTPNYGTNTTTVTLELQTIDVDTLASLEKQQKGLVKITTAQWREPRSKDANAYFHVLSDKLADEMRMSKPRMKNYLLYLYGQRQRDEKGKLVVIKTNAPESQIVERSDIHMWFYRDSEDGVPLYIMLENSRFYDSKQMSILIDGVIEQCRQIGVETLSPKEIQRLKDAWGIDIEQENIVKRTT